MMVNDIGKVCNGVYIMNRKNRVILKKSVFMVVFYEFVFVNNYVGVFDGGWFFGFQCFFDIFFVVIYGFVDFFCDFVVEFYLFLWRCVRGDVVYFDSFVGVDVGVEEFFYWWVQI